MAKDITVYNVPDEMRERLKRLATVRHTSVNTIIIDLLSKEIDKENQPGGNKPS